ncbi:aldo/keto reductase [Sporolactobacillus laevolacticus]|uniref:Glyoxal reductase n=1 Tax=Sporolactobacillus laevolacticus DSM 442 TaxID=1395513 RepID=V6IYA0_9BACL|nr:aldo/keto reductase [Sporolactobacillus laevolacticus]EST12443.1 glyoxal reductase [Sporolactobacillus laevolacticus DSM 442]
MVTSINDTVRLNNGLEMPLHGFGVYLITDEDKGRAAIRQALGSGYRAFDTAEFYKNEALLGTLLKESEVPRNELFITTKIDNPLQGYDSTLRAIERSLKDLQLEQIDLILVHWPSKKHFFETWRAFEKLYDEKLVKAIGVSNFEVHHLEQLAARANVKPAVDQMEIHPYFTQSALRDYLRANDIAAEAWSPLGRGAVLSDATISRIAEKYGKSPAQVIIRWHLQSGTIVIPKSQTPSRIKQNTEVYDFVLTEDELKEIDALDRKDGRNGPVPDEVFEEN